MAMMQANPKVTAYEVAARIYCAKIGANPDQMLAVPHPHLANINVNVPFWYTIAERMFDLHMLLSSISQARLEGTKIGQALKESNDSAIVKP
jgi:hypothetical protein